MGAALAQPPIDRWERESPRPRRLARRLLECALRRRCHREVHAELAPLLRTMTERQVLHGVAIARASASLRPLEDGSRAPAESDRWRDHDARARRDWRPGGAQGAAAPHPDRRE